MKRYYLSKIYEDTSGPFPVWKHRLQDHPNVAYVGGEIAVDPNTGIPTEQALLVLVGSKNHSALVADSGLIAMPDVPLDLKVASIHGPTKVAAKAAIRALGFTKAQVDALWDNADGFRDVINHYGRRNNPTFDANDFDLSET